MRLAKSASVFSNGVAVRPEICRAMDVIDEIHKGETGGKHAVFTSIVDGQHSVKHSLHYNGLAVDLRIWYLEDVEEFTEILIDFFGSKYQVRLEATHIHTEFQPTRKEP